MTSAITATGLRKSFGGKAVLDGIDLEVGAGTVFSLLGPNGAGKTTTVQIMSTLVHADGGEVRVAGHDLARDPAAVRAAIGVTGQFSAVDNLLTGQENLLLMADLHHLSLAEGRRRAAGLLDKFDLADAAAKTAATYSGGMRRRLDLAMTLVGDPRIIFLDEPTTGLDPRSRRMMWQTIRELVAGGVTIFLTTQYLDEADAAGRPDRRARPRQGGRRRNPRTSSSAASPGLTSGCASPTPQGSTRRHEPSAARSVTRTPSRWRSPATAARPRCGSY